MASTVRPPALQAAQDLFVRAEARRVATSDALNETGTRAEHGQFFTPAPAAQLIASFATIGDTLAVLDPGAGSGMLSAAVAARWLTETSGGKLRIVAVERDGLVVASLRETLADCQTTASRLGRDLAYEVIHGDFILDDGAPGGGFDLVIQNPPYAKLAAGAPERQAVKRAGADAPNLYAAFLALGLTRLRPGGQLVAITPRSFCNGPYFAAFRAYLLDHLSLDRIHVFQSRSSVFSDTAVLQENVIFSGAAGGPRSTVLITQSDDHSDAPSSRAVPYEEVVRDSDPHRFIRIAADDKDTAVAEKMAGLGATLTDLGLTVSTGRVVDFRSRGALSDTEAAGGRPLIYPGNLRGGRVDWPRQIRKAQWFAPSDAREESMLFPEGWYCVVKRFSSKEEPRRVVAAVWSPREHPGSVAFENHLNVIHRAGAGLDEALATGLCVWLNSTLLDAFFRTFSGHTQVNATDLRSMRWPTEPQLRALARDLRAHVPDQGEVDALVAAMLS